MTSQKWRRSLLRAKRLASSKVGGSVLTYSEPEASRVHGKMAKPKTEHKRNLTRIDNIGVPVRARREQTTRQPQISLEKKPGLEEQQPLTRHFRQITHCAVNALPRLAPAEPAAPLPWHPLPLPPCTPDTCCEHAAIDRCNVHGRCACRATSSQCRRPGSNQDKPSRRTACTASALVSPCRLGEPTQSRHSAP